MHKWYNFRSSDRYEPVGKLTKINMKKVFITIIFF